MKCRKVIFRIITLQFEANFRQILLQFNGSRSSEVIHVKYHVDLLVAEKCVKSTTYSILWTNLYAGCRETPIATKTEPAEDRIVCKNSRGGSQRTVVSKINFARVIPWTTMVGLVEPRLSIWRRLKSAS